MKLSDLISSSDIDYLIAVSREAGAEIMRVYDKVDHEVEYKNDSSPLTRADRESHRTIVYHLGKRWPEIPIISEEQAEVPYSLRKEWKLFWLVDPLDGTKEFVKRNGEFTVNIALVQESIPVVGVIYAPCMNELFYAVRGEGAHKIGPDGSRSELRGQSAAVDNELLVVTSRSHRSSAVHDYISEKTARGYKVEELSVGSSIKFCRLAEGRAHVYPRYGATMEWDIAAGHVILEEAGGNIVDAKTLLSPVYNKIDLRNSDFIASCGKVDICTSEGVTECKT